MLCSSWVSCTYSRRNRIQSINEIIITEIYCCYRDNYLLSDPLRYNFH